ncbi:N-acetylglucosamine kinase [Rariglobus hedericola]|uniref:ATPase n=1 Tax=Rariglobus hedericola TaxID=2597822 RepID=A0A556QGV2_9BACT|nr:BadF/BadG/BcrA/BcrD ATPase family protein [Rariglobus hedericola]TSJ75868.1 ATPase [Rariglobus hedericola]
MKIGVDGGGTKTDLILIDDRGDIVARRVTTGCNPNSNGPENARITLEEALGTLAAHHPVSHTLLCMAGAPAFWRETAEALNAGGLFGEVSALDDSRPVLEIATGGRPGLVLHGGTGSFIAAQAPDGSLHYAGGTGWRFGDPGSGYDLGRRTISKALLELQGWQLSTSLSTLVRDHTGLVHSAAITRHFYKHPEPNRQISSLAPGLLRLAEEGDHAAHQVVAESVTALLQLAEMVTTKLFAGWHLDTLRAGVSGPILTHPAVRPILATRSSLNLRPLDELPIEGVRRLLIRLPSS